jgi:hypothetical protein
VDRLLQQKTLQRRLEEARRKERMAEMRTVDVVVERTSLGPSCPEQRC